jgi:hypothetical protein
MNPPPINRLTIAAGNTRNAANTRKPKKKRTNPPIMTSPRIAPSMKPKYPRGATQGNIPTQAEKKAGDNNAPPFNTINAAAVEDNAAGIHQYLTRNGGRRNGPYKTPPEGRAWATGIAGPICTGTFVR